MSLLRASDLRIRRRVEPLIEGQIRPPVDMTVVAERMGAEIRQLEIAEDLAGILYQEETRKVIVVNAQHSAARQRVSAARQVGHLVLHARERVRVDEGFKVDIRHPDRGSIEDIEEVEANLFALHLLIPTTWIEADVLGWVFDFSDEMRASELAERYGVPPGVLLLRLLSFESWGHAA